ncbi:MAG: phytase [Mangrovibacterium sp.]
MKKRTLFNTILAVLLLPGTATCDQSNRKAQKAAEKIGLTVTARYETTPVPQPVGKDAADDPAIWIHPEDPGQSRIIGTDKKGGLAVYNLQGKQLFYYTDGNMNNVDVRPGFVLGTDTLDLVVASNRSTQSLSLYRIRKDGSLSNCAARLLTSQMIDKVYGICLYTSPVSGNFYVFVNSKRGEVEQWELFATDSLIDARLVRSLKLETQVEGMVADDRHQTLFVGQEVAGIWKFNAEPDGGQQAVLLEKCSMNDNEQIRYDIEGLALYLLPGGEGYLVASSQGNYSYAVYERKSPHTYLGSFRITGGKIDGAEETDGLDIYSYGLNEDFAHGLLVVQDGFNVDGEQAFPQNFKLVAWEDIAALFEPALKMN